MEDIVNPGDSVNEGDMIMILEAMKMEIDITAPKTGKIASINVNVNDSVADGTTSSHNGVSMKFKHLLFSVLFAFTALTSTVQASVHEAAAAAPAQEESISF